MQAWNEADQPDRYLGAFIETITPFDELSFKQQAALHAVQANLAGTVMGETNGAFDYASLNFLCVLMLW